MSHPYPQLDVSPRLDGKFNVWKRYANQPWTIVRVFQTQDAAQEYIGRVLNNWRNNSNV